MKKRTIIYFCITIFFLIISTILLFKTDLKNNVSLSKTIEIILILYLVRISFGCIFFIKKQYESQKYSYSIIMNLGLLFFILINIVRLVNVLIFNWNVMNIKDIYNTTINSFSFFAMLTLPCIIILSIYSIITNIVLIQKEGFSPNKLLGILLGILALLGLVGSQAIYMITSTISGKQLVLKKLIDICFNVTLSYFYTLIIATLYCNIKAAKHIPSYDKDYIIILGSKINKDGTLTPLLKARVDKAIEFDKNQYKKTNKKIYYIPSGGQGNDEIISEALAIKKYLISEGIKQDRIIIEDKSINTQQNMEFSKRIIDDISSDAKIVFSTTSYHVFRSGVIASNCGIECEGMGSKTKWYFYTNALIREFIANICLEWKKHILLIVLINFSVSILVIIGYHYKFITI